MTEAEWLLWGEPIPLLTFVGNTASARKLRLFTVACCRRLHGGKLSAEERKAIETAERYADGLLAVDHLVEACAWVSDHPRLQQGPVHCAVCVSISPYVDIAVEEIARRAGEDFIKRRFRWLLDRRAGEYAERSELAVFADFLRDIFPFRAVSSDPSWRTSTVTTLATQMYDSRDFSAMPILADALQDAGCDSTDVLDHCRSPGPHVRGCWAVDWALRKE